MRNEINRKRNHAKLLTQGSGAGAARSRSVLPKPEPSLWAPAPKVDFFLILMKCLKYLFTRMLFTYTRMTVHIVETTQTQNIP